MKEEFNLSKKIETIIEDLPTGRGYDSEDYIEVDDVKEFIRLLKVNIQIVIFNHPQLRAKAIEEIDKLAGEDLILK